MTKIGNFTKDNIRNGGFVSGGHRIKYVSDDKEFVVIYNKCGMFMGFFLSYESDGVFIDEDRSCLSDKNGFASIKECLKFYHIHEQAEEEEPATNVVQPSPVIQQWMDIKAKHPDALILFRCGDFYETYDNDAEDCGRILGIIVRKYHETEANDIKVAGFPYHALDTYLPKLVRAGYRVAICDQLEDPKLTKKLVKRSITELVTPGIAKEPPAENAKVVAIKQEEKAATEMVGDMALLQPSKVCTGQNEMRTVLMEEVDADKVVVRQVNGNGDFGICVCLKEKKAVAIACWERSGVNGKREYRFCSMAPKFREFSKAL